MAWANEACRYGREGEEGDGSSKGQVRPGSERESERARERESERERERRAAWAEITHEPEVDQIVVSV